MKWIPHLTLLYECRCVTTIWISLKGLRGVFSFTLLGLLEVKPSRCIRIDTNVMKLGGGIMQCFGVECFKAPLLERKGYNSNFFWIMLCDFAKTADGKQSECCFINGCSLARCECIMMRR